jgi:hypothetical protein
MPRLRCRAADYVAAGEYRFQAHAHPVRGKEDRERYTIRPQHTPDFLREYRRQRRPKDSLCRPTRCATDSPLILLEPVPISTSSRSCWATPPCPPQSFIPMSLSNTSVRIRSPLDLLGAAEANVLVETTVGPTGKQPAPLRSRRRSPCSEQYYRRSSPAPAQQMVKRRIICACSHQRFSYHSCRDRHCPM